MKSLLLTSLIIFSLACDDAFSQRKIGGRVTDEKGNGIPGVNVTVKGTSVGTVTDVDGNYSLEVEDSDAILQFSYFGYATEEIEIGSQSSYNIMFESGDIRTRLWCCTSHSPPDCQKKKSELEETHEPDEVYIRTGN